VKTEPVGSRDLTSLEEVQNFKGRTTTRVPCGNSRDERRKTFCFGGLLGIQIPSSVFPKERNCIVNSELGVWDLGFGICDLGFGIWNLELRRWSMDQENTLCLRHFPQRETSMIKFCTIDE
jgi:hypothetical protein